MTAAIYLMRLASRKATKAASERRKRMRQAEREGVPPGQAYAVAVRRAAKAALDPKETR